MRYRNSEFWNRNSDFLTLQTSEFKKYFPTGIFGIKNGIEIPLTMGVPEIGTKNWNSQPSGSRSTICQAWHLNTVMHMSFLLALEHRANQFRKIGNSIKSEAHLHSWMLDKTGTINTCLLDHGEILQQEQLDVRGASEEVRQVHRTLTWCKEGGITQLLYENANGLSNRMCGNNKLSTARDLF
jgi:hypothetical protein